MAKRAALVPVCVALLTVSAPADAGVGDFLTDVGRALGKPFGGFIESLVTPSLRSVDNTLVADVDRRLGQRIEEVHRTAGGLIDETNTAVAARIAQADAAAGARIAQADSAARARIAQTDAAIADRLSQVDGIMAARIAQIGVTGDRLIDHAVGKLDGTLDKNIKLAGNEARKTVEELNRVSAERLSQVDGLLESRVNQLQGVVQQSVAEADQAIAERLEQVDEISERRVGNLDVIGTRQILNLEGTLTRLAGLVATLALVVLMLFSLGKEVWARWKDAPELDQFMSRLWSIADRRLVLGLVRVVVAHAAILAVSLGILLLFSRKPSAEVRARSQALLEVHQSGFLAGEQNLDYRAALYNASQLAIIEPGSASSYDLRTQKLKLIRDTLVRPGSFERPETVRSLARSIATLDEEVKRRSHDSDPDLLTLECYIRWQLASDRPGEVTAAADCRHALDTAVKIKAGKAFLLERLARHYVGLGRFFPSWGGTPDAPLEGAEEPLPGLDHIYSYDTLVETLDEASTRGYLALLDAEVELERAGRDPTRVASAKDARKRAADVVVSAWRVFDGKLKSDEWISGTSAELAVFLLNDAIVTRALFVVARPDADRLPGKIKDIEDPFVRMRVVPPRVEWMRRYLGWLGDGARRVATFEESKRFSSFEDQVLAFERAFIAVKSAAAPSTEQRVAAARAAAALGLYVTQAGRRVPLAAELLAGEKLDAGRAAELESLANDRHVRLL